VEGAKTISGRPGMRLKGSTLRSYVSVLESERRREAVVARVPPETAALIACPPLASTWVDWRHVVHITLAIESIAGLAGVREFARKMIEEAKKPHLRLVEGLLRLFGTSPATIFSHMNDLVKHTIENQEFIYTSLSERSGVMEMRYFIDEEVPHCIHISAIATLQATLDACGVNGIIDPPEPIGVNRVAYKIQW
jgi:hypothetical protein